MFKIPSIVLILMAGITSATAQIFPSNWVSPEPLKSAEAPIQDQLDTGKAMTSTAMSMADVRNARLFIVYMLLYQKLDKNEQHKLYREQEAWLQNKATHLAKFQPVSTGSDAKLEIISEDMDFTEKRIQELSERLAKLK